MDLRFPESPKRSCRNILLTGSTGFVGAYVTRELLEQGHNVYAIVRDEKKLADIVRLSPNRLTILTGDLLNDADLETLAHELRDKVEDLDIVIHMVGGGPLTSNARFTRAIFDLNHRTTANLIRLLEGSNTLPHEKAKLATEQLLEDLTRKHNFRTAIIRFPQMYGGHDDAFMQMVKLIRVGVFPLVQDRVGSLPLIHVKDAANATCAVVTNPDQLDGNYSVNLICEGSYSYDQVVELVKQAYGKGRTIKFPYLVMYCAILMLEVLFRIIGRPEPLNRKRLISLTKERVIDSAKFVTAFKFVFQQNVKKFVVHQPSRTSFLFTKGRFTPQS